MDDNNKNKKMTPFGFIICVIFLMSFILSGLYGAIHGEAHYNIKTHSMIDVATARAGGIMGIIFGTLGLIVVTILFIHSRKR